MMMFQPYSWIFTNKKQTVYEVYEVDGTMNTISADIESNEFK